MDVRTGRQGERSWRKATNHTFSIKRLPKSSRDTQLQHISYQWDVEVGGNGAGHAPAWTLRNYIVVKCRVIDIRASCHKHMRELHESSLRSKLLFCRLLPSNRLFTYQKNHRFIEIPRNFHHRVPAHVARDPKQLLRCT